MDPQILLTRLKNLTLTLMGCGILNLAACKPRSSSLDSSTASSEGMLDELGLCPSDTYSPVGDYLDNIVATGNDINEDDLEGALADSEGYMGPCLSESNSGTSDGFGLVNPVAAGVAAEKVGQILWNPKVEKGLVYAAEQGRRIFKLRPQSRIPSTIMKTSRARIALNSEPSEINKIYPRIYLTGVNTLKVNSNFISHFIEQAQLPVANNMARDFNFIESLISKAEQALKTPNGLATLTSDIETLKLIQSKYKSLQYAFDIFENGIRGSKYTNKFTVILEHLQDALVKSSSEGVAKNLKLLKNLGNSEQVKKQIAMDLKNFTPMTPEDFIRWMEVRMRSLAAIARPNSQISAAEFHNSRKIVKAMVTLFNTARQSAQAGLDDTHKVLTTINGKMGIIEDQIAAGKLSVAKNQGVPISDELRGLIADVTSHTYFKAVWWPIK